MAMKKHLYIVLALISICAPCLEAQSDELVLSLQVQNPSPVSCIDFSPDGKFLASAHGPLVEVWDLEEAKLRFSFRHSAPVIAVEFASGTGMLYALGADHVVRVFNPKQGIQTAEFSLITGVKYSIYSLHSSLAVSADGKTIAATGAYGILLVVDGKQRFLDPSFFGKTDEDATTTQYFLSCASLSSDGQRLAVGTSDGTVFWYDTERAKVTWTFSPGGNLADLHVSADARYLYVSLWSTIKVYDTLAKKAVHSLTNLWAVYSDLSLGADTFVATAVSNGPVASVLDSLDGKILATFPLEFPEYSAIAISDDGLRVAMGYKDGLIRIFSRDSDGWVSLFSATDSGEWLVYSHDGYWDGSPGSDELLSLSRGGSTWRADQFAAFTNRPDILLERFGSSRVGLVESFRAQYLKRLKRLGLSNDSPVLFGSAPNARIRSAKEQGVSVELVCDFSAGKNGGVLASYQVSVNGVPQFGVSGKPLSGTYSQVKEEIQLIPGENYIEMYCVDTNGAVSAKAGASIEGDEAPAGSLYYLGIGVSAYQDRNLSLAYPAKDVKDLQDLLQSTGPGGRYAKVITQVFTDRQAGGGVIAKASEFIAQLRPEDSLILMVAGHGVQDIDEDSTYYFVAWDTEVSDLVGTGIPFSAIENLLYQAKARNKLFLLDTCASGERSDEYEAGLAALSGGSVGAKVITQGRSLSVLPTGSPPVAAVDRARYLYNDLARRSGAVIFSSSRGEEVSFESDEFENGLFTEFLLRGLGGEADLDSSGTVDMSELRTFVAEEVARETKSKPALYFSPQHPTVDKDNIYCSLELPVPKQSARKVGTLKPVPPSMVKIQGEGMSFAIATHELTMGEFHVFMEQSSGGSVSLIAGASMDLPMRMSWLDAIQYCNWLSTQLGYEPVYKLIPSTKASSGKQAEYSFQLNPDAGGFRLPTEAEWMYAARGGPESKGFRFSGGNVLAELAWAGMSNTPTYMPVMRLVPNELGLYDMNGNIEEMVWELSSQTERKVLKDSNGALIIKEGHSAELKTKGGEFSDYIDHFIFELDSFGTEMTGGLRLVRTIVQ